MYWKTFLIILIGSLFLAPPVFADDDCENHVLYPVEESLCHTYCTRLDCGKITDGDPMTEPQASLKACANIATTFWSKYLDIKLSEVDSVMTPFQSMYSLHMTYCCMDCGGGGV